MDKYKMKNYENRCISCRFFDVKKNQCKQTKESVTKDTPSCSKWRYFA